MPEPSSPQTNSKLRDLRKINVEDVINPDDIRLYFAQRVPEVAAIPTVRLSPENLIGMSRLFNAMRIENPEAFAELWFAPLPCADYLITVNIESESAGDSACDYLRANAESDWEICLAASLTNCVWRLHRLHRAWVAAGKPIHETCRIGLVSNN